MFGRDRGADGTRYGQKQRQRCWRLANIESTHPTNKIWYKSPVLLLESGVTAQVWLDVQGGPGECVSSLEPTLINGEYFPMLMSEELSNWVGQLKRMLGRAIVAYERGSQS
ncbi:hypothetical protein [Streptomyces sp. NPDC007172]|uniref:hypothetical protein n=1 Tax=unclassified Streptomyces TaxID=2593676 RepID=UPI0036B357E1